MPQPATKRKSATRRRLLFPDSPPVVANHCEPLPAWANLIRSEDEQWAWEDGRLVHQGRQKAKTKEQHPSKLQKLLVKHVYAAQDKSRSVRDCIDGLLGELSSTGWALNLGAGESDPRPRTINLDIQDSEHIDILAKGTELPFHDQSLDLVISQEVLEHIDAPLDTIAEVHRVLRSGGKFYCQVPFIIGFHPGPSDYWRFSKQALEHLFDNESWKLQTLDLTLGHGSGLYRVLVEFLAVTASAISQRLYRPTKLLAALLCMPLQWFDFLTPLSQEKDRIPAGYFCVAVKR
jgi:SAM-dependent methyltransferase